MDQTWMLNQLGGVAGYPEQRALDAAVARLVALEADTTAYEAAWVAYTPTPGNFTGTLLYGRYRQVGKTVDVQVGYTLATITGILSVSLPVTVATYLTTNLPPVGTAKGLDSGTAYYTGVCLATGSSTVQFVSHGGTGVWDNSGGRPFAWGVSDVLQFSARYEAA